MENKARFLFNKVEIRRESVEGDKHRLNIRFQNELLFVGFVTHYRENTGDERTEDDFISALLDTCAEKDSLRYVNFENLRCKVIQGFQQLRENQLSGDSRESMEISLKPKEEPTFFNKKEENKTWLLFNKVEIRRGRSADGEEHRLNITFKNEFKAAGLVRYYKENTGDGKTEDDFISALLDDCEKEKDDLRYVNHENLRSKVLQGFQKLRENQLSGDSRESMEIIVKPKEPREVDSSREKIQNEDSTIQESGDKL